MILTVTGIQFMEKVKGFVIYKVIRYFMENHKIPFFHARYFTLSAKFFTIDIGR